MLNATKNVLPSGSCYVIIIIASLITCQTKQLIFTILLLGKFLLAPHSMKFQLYCTCWYFCYWFHSFTLCCNDFHIAFSYTWTLSAPLLSVDDRASYCHRWRRPVELSPSCNHLLFFCFSDRIFSLPVRGKLLHMCPGSYPLLFMWLPFCVILFNVLYPIILYM